MDIVEEIRQNPESGARRLAAEYKAGLMTLARRFCNDPGDAEELVNATFAAVVENIESHLEQASFFGWMCQILTSLHSRNVRRKSHGDIVYPGVVPDAIDEKAQQEIYDNLDHSLVREAIGKLTKEERDLLIMHYFMDMPVAQMAKVLAMPSGTVMSKLYYARKALAAKLGVKAQEAVKKPGVKATLIALALCATAALGAVWWGELSGRAVDGAAGGATSTLPAIGETGGVSPVASTPSPVTPDSPVQPVITATPLSNSPTLPLSNSTLGDQNMNKTTLLAASAAFAIAAGASAPAATTITVDSVTQRWPWNNKVDITYTITGGQNLADSEFLKIVFTTVINGTTYTIDGVSDVGASANAGTHTVTWTAPTGVKCANCTMRAAIYDVDAPSGDDYMVIDLQTGAVTWEGLLATQADSNARYNANEYKMDKLVLRKIPAGGPYPTGDSANYASNNSATTWTTDRDYYIGIFPVTQRQYWRIVGMNPASKTATIEGNTRDHRPVETVSWNTLRASASQSDPIPTVDSDSGSFFQRLMFKTGNKFTFDMPTELMFEIAERAGATTAYYWGDNMDTRYVVCSENNGGSTFAVGSKLPNAWGLYDTAGNVWEMCRDIAYDNLANAPDPFTVKNGMAAYRPLRGGANNDNQSSSDGFRSSHRLLTQITPADAKAYAGFRVAMVAE